VRFDYRECRRHRDGGIEGVAAVFEYFKAGLRGQRMRSRDRMAARSSGLNRGHMKNYYAGKEESACDSHLENFFCSARFTAACVNLETSPP
jgi:hypothetical protein